LISFFFSSRRRHTRLVSDWSSDVCSSDLKRSPKSGKVRAVVVPDVSGRSLLPHVAKKVLPSVSVYTDEWAPYEKLGQMGYAHSRSEERRVGKESRDRWGRGN